MLAILKTIGLGVLSLISIIVLALAFYATLTLIICAIDYIIRKVKGDE